MSVAAMTMDDQRPLMNNFDSMKQYDHITNAGGPASSVVGGVAVGAPTSGPASPTPSTSEEQQQQQHHHHHHHHHASHHHHHHHQSHQLKQQPTTTVQPQQQQQPQIPFDAATTAPAVAVVEQRQRLLEEEIQNLKLEQTRLSQQCIDAQRREKILMRRLANKEQEFQDYVSQIAEYKAAQAPGAAALRSALLDPAVNLLFEKLKKELKATKAKLEETQNELSAWKFTPDSNTGKRLMAKCRLLYQENEELGKMTSNGRLAKLETELAMQKSFSEEVKKSQSELDDFLQELDEDVEGMQSTILFLQQELKTTRDRIQVLEKENSQLKSGEGSSENTTDASDAQQQLHRLAINSGINNTAYAVHSVNTTADIINNIINNQIPASAVGANTNMITNNISTVSNNVPNQIETIDEKMCPRTIQNILPMPPRSNPNEFMNGLEEPKPDNAFIAATDDGGHSNNSDVVKLSRTISTTPRKRSYDESDATTENAAGSLAAMVVAAPRTLPPKKSKLRIMPARRASAQSLEMTTEVDNAALPVPSVIAINTTNIQQDMVALPAHAANTPPVDNAVAGKASEEGGALNIALDDEVANNNTGGAGTVAPQRIMTRRRSLRNQPNGDSNH